MYEITQGDLTPAMLIDLVDEGVAANVSDADAPLFMRWHRPDGTYAEVAITNIDLNIGSVMHTWAAGETNIPGIHRAQVVVPKAAGDESFPGDGSYIRWYVHPKLS